MSNDCRPKVPMKLLAEQALYNDYFTHLFRVTDHEVKRYV